ncbi:MAG: zinc metalloprotease HtpX [Microcoleaceae cyanobacterium]
MASPTNHTDLEIGLTAIAQKQYTKAIAYLEPIARAHLKTSHRMRAKMGLVVAYEQTAEIQKAIALCDGLTQSSQAKVKHWAQHRRATLQKRYPEAENPTPNAISTGFMAFDPTQQPPKVQAATSSQVPSLPTPPKPKPPQKPPIPPPPKLSKNTVKLPQPATQTVTPPTAEPTNLSPQPLQWRNAPRAQNWPRLKQPQFWRLRIEQIFTAIALLWFTPRLVEFFMDIANDILRELPFVPTLQLFYRDPTTVVYLTLGILYILSPWILDSVLKLAVGLQSLPMTTLFQRSPETNRLLRSYCQQRKWQLPTLKLLPITVPVVLSYGCLPRFSRIVVSQGLLDQLTEDELALILAREAAQMGHWDSFILSFVTIVSQIPYLIYWQLGYWSEQLANPNNISWPRWAPGGVKSLIKVIYPVIRGINFVIAPVSYGLFWILRGFGLWLSRRRVYYSDRAACNLTGNPNALTRALVKIAIGLADEVRQQRKTRFLLEGFELLMPVGYHQALTFGSLAPNYPIVSLLEWEITNPYHPWLEVNQSHPVMGDRLRLLGRYAQFWKVEPELDLTELKPSSQAVEYQRLLLQGAPYFGLLGGILIGSAIWLIGGIFAALGVWQLEWLLGDTAILTGCIPIGCSLGLFLRMNSFFPELKPSQRRIQPDLAELYANPQNIPVDSLGICIEGQLLGRSITSNRMGQDLILATSSGLVKLHYIPALTPLANFSTQFPHPADWVNQTVQVTGWWRRGATPSIDIETIQKCDRRVQIQGGHPIWSTLIAGVLAFWGLSFVFQGGF